jgi:serine protease Do
MAEALGQRQLRGSIVAWVLPDEPAQKAGMIAGDVVLRFNGQTVSDERALLRTITTRKPGDQVTFSIWRNGQQIELKVTLEPWPATVRALNAPPPQSNVRLIIPPDLGLAVADLTDALRTANGIKSDVKGVLVTAVAPGSDAARQGMAAGDVVIQLGPIPVQSSEDLRRETDRARGAGRRFGLFMVLSKTQPAAIAQFPGPNWIALRIAAN